MEGVPNREELKAELMDLKIKAYDADSYAVHDKVYQWSEELKTLHPDFDNYELYHLLIGSSEKREKFIRSL